MNTIIENLNWRYATKSFDSSKLILEKDLDTILNAFNLTASSYGLQPLKLVVIHDKKIQQDLLPFSMRQNQVVEASHLLIFCIDTKIDSETIIDYFDRVKETRSTPNHILDPFKNFLIEDFKQKSQEEKEKWATNQAYLAMGNLITVCALLKIDACPMEGFSAEKYDEILGLDKANLKSVLVMPIGYRSEKDFMASLKKVRKPLKEVVIFK